jgi:hypothetical protein
MKKLTLALLLLMTLALVAQNTIVEQATEILIRNTVTNAVALRVIKPAANVAPFIELGTQTNTWFSVGSTGAVTATTYFGDGSNLTGISGGSVSFNNDQFDSITTTNIKDGVLLTNINVFGKTLAGTNVTGALTEPAIYAINPNQDQSTVEVGASEDVGAFPEVLLSRAGVARWSLRSTPSNDTNPDAFEFNLTGIGPALLISTNRTVYFGGSVNPEAQVHIATAADAKVLRLETAPASTVDAPKMDTLQSDTTTSDATTTTLQTISIAANTTHFIEARVVARRTAGASGTAQDGAVYVIRAAVKNVAGTATLIGAVDASLTREDQAAWSATIDVTGASARVRVAGDTDNDVSWHTTTMVQKVSE